MNKASVIALLIAVASATTMDIPLENWQAIAPKASSVKMHLHGAHRLSSTASSVKWSTCPS